MNDHADAVYFAPQDYAPVSKRLGAFAIDLVVYFLAAISISMAAQYTFVPVNVLKNTTSAEKKRILNERLKPVKVPLSLVIFGIAPLYHLSMRRSRGGTLGYRIMGVRIVDKDGEIPTWKILGKRFLIGLPATSFLGMSYRNCLKSSRKQAEHDKLSGTWVVRKKAKPAGPARAVYQTALMGTFLLTYVDIEPLPAIPEEISTSPLAETECKISPQQNPETLHA